MGVEIADPFVSVFGQDANALTTQFMKYNHMMFGLPNGERIEFSLKGLAAAITPITDRCGSG